MSFLFPWFVAGAVAVGLPVVFHLIRRAPRGRVDFSSLMFLKTSPPRLTKRSRLDHILLLLLRGLCLILLALAFARPFFPDTTLLGTEAVGGRRIAILVDTSASLGRGDCWEKSRAAVDDILDDLETNDDVALFTFDERVVSHVAFDDDSQRNELSAKKAAVRSALESVEPKFSATNTGVALVHVAEQLQVGLHVAATSEAEGEEASSSRPSVTQQIILVSDIQRGSKLEALASYEWPSQVRVTLRQIEPKSTTNASLSTIGEPRDGIVRVQVRNELDSDREQFELGWESEDERTPVYVPPGEVRVVRLPQPEGGPSRILQLSGDQCEFDNTHFVSTSVVRELFVRYVGQTSPDDVGTIPYFLTRALEGVGRDEIHVACRPEFEADETPNPRLVVVDQVVDEELSNQLTEFVEAGGTVIYVASETTTAESLGQLLDDPPLAFEHVEGDYVMLAKVNLAHPLFAALNSAEFSDFTKIRFWRHRRVELADSSDAVRVASFDDGDPAILERRLGRGRLILLLSGWNSADSQWARSSKFIPQLHGLLLGATATKSSHQLEIGDSIPTPAEFAEFKLTWPNGDSKTWQGGDTVSAVATEPGIYAAEVDQLPTQFATNLDVHESETAPFNPAELERRGVRLGEQLTHAEEIERMRQLKTVEIEGRQKVWRWTLLAVIVLLTVETWIANRTARQSFADEQAAVAPQ